MISLFHISLLSSFLLFIIPKKAKFLFALTLQSLLIVSTSVWAIESFSHTYELNIPLGISTWSGEIILTIDRLSAFFILIINFVCLAGSLYAKGYLRQYIERKRSVSIALHLFSFLWLNASMVMVTAMKDGLAFLLAWELMSLTSFILVIFEGEKESTLKTGINYLLQMHFGFAMIMFGFLMVKDATGEMSFEALGSYFEQHSNTIVYLIFFVGFGIKAGFMPLHTWLPKAHPAAPSHVSGVMSGVMIKLGIYGILRVTSYVSQDLKLIGTVVLIVAIVSGVLGVILAIMQHDLKRLLAYHSIENIGIIGIGIGLSILGIATRDDTLATLAMAGALLHVINHALFKSLLFFSTGNIFLATHNVNMDHLGGLARKMRFTSIAFLVGALAISGIPPFNGFISEFLIYQGIVNNFTFAGFSMSLAGLCGFTALVLIGGLCLYCFTKAFGLTFLGSRRMAHPPDLAPIPRVTFVPLAMLVIAILAIGMVPSLCLYPLEGALATMHNLRSPETTMENIFGTLTNISIANVMLVTAVVSVSLLRYSLRRKNASEFGPTWGCGYPAGDFRHQYTPTSYADSLLQMTRPAVSFKKEYREISETEIFPQRRKFHTQTGDRLEQSTVTRIIELLITYLPMAGRAQTGLINHYLLYPLAFLVIMGILTFLKYI